jgi:hypothetical protein
MTDKSYIDNSLFLIDFKISETIQRNTNNIEDTTIESLASITPIDDYKLKKKQKVLYNNNKDRYFFSKILNNSIIKYNKISFTTNEQSQESEFKKSKTWEYKYEDAVIEYIFHDFYYKLKNDNDNLYNLYNTFLQEMYNLGNTDVKKELNDEGIYLFDYDTNQTKTTVNVKIIEYLIKQLDAINIVPKKIHDIENKISTIKRKIVRNKSQIKKYNKELFITKKELLKEIQRFKNYKKRITVRYPNSYDPLINIEYKDQINHDTNEASLEYARALYSYYKTNRENLIFRIIFYNHYLSYDMKDAYGSINMVTLTRNSMEIDPSFFFIDSIELNNKINYYLKYCKEKNTVRKKRLKQYVNSLKDEWYNLLYNLGFDWGELT